MHSMMRRLPLRIFNCQQFPLLLNFNFRRQFGRFQFLNKLPAGNGKTTNLQHHLLQKQMASSFAEIEKIEFKHGKFPRFLNFECIDGKNNKKYIRLSKQPPVFHEFVKSIRPNCEYKLEIHPTKNGQLQFTMELFKNTRNASSHQDLIFFPVSLLPEFRDRMAKILSKFDGSHTQQCEPCPSPFPKWIKAAIEEEKVDEQPQYRNYRRESMKYSMDPDKPADKRISIEFNRGARGKKYIQIEQKHDNYKQRLNAKSAEDEYFYIYFPNILVPEDGYNLLSGMIDLSNDFKQKGDFSIQRNNHQSSLICRQIVKGKFYDYKLEIHSYNDQQQLGFRMETITTDGAPWHKPTKLFVPIHIFDWLQAQMALTLAADLDLGDYENREEIDEDKLPLPLSNN